MIDLKEFCGNEEYLSWINAPFSHGDFVYATDGAVAVRIRAVKPHDAPERKREAAVLDEWFIRLQSARFERPAFRLPDTEEISKKTDCNECSGRGTYHDCPECTCTCDECSGKGEVETTEKISVAAFGSKFRLPYLRKILALPGVEIADISRDGLKPALFRFDGGVAAIMPLRVHLDKVVEIIKVGTVPAS